MGQRNRIGRSSVAVLSFLALFVGEAPASAQMGTGGLQGTVTSATSGAPIAGATLVAYDTPSGIQAGSTTTDASGQYTLPLVMGTYNLRISASGYATELHNQMPCVAADCPVGSDATAISVATMGMGTRNVSLQPEGRISGTVRRASDSTAVAGAGVSVYNAAGSFAGATGTSDSGTYSIGALPAGTYFVRTSSTSAVVGQVFGGPTCPGVTGAQPCRVTSGTPVTVTAGQTTTVDISAPATGNISGTLAFPAASSPLSTKVFLLAGRETVGSTFTAGKSFTFNGLAPGVYTVRAQFGNQLMDASGTVTVTSGATASVTLSSTDYTGGISGTVTFATLPFNGETVPPVVQVYDSSGVLVRTASLTPTAGSSFGSSIPEPGTPAGGTFTWAVYGLGSGRYYVRTSNPAQGIGSFRPYATPPGGYLVDELYDNITCVASDCMPTKGTPIDVTSSVGGTSVTSGVNFTLEYGATISGVLPSFTFSGATHIHDSRGVELLNRSAPDGRSGYYAPGLPAGTYYLKIDRDGFNQTAAAVYKDMPCDACSVTSGTPVAVAAGESKTGIDFTKLTGYAIQGTVRSTASAPLSTITVEVYGPDGVLVDSAASLADGTYEVPVLAPGVYYARTRNDRGYVDVLYGGTACDGCDPLQGTAITVGAADTTGIDFTLSAGADVSGTVTKQPSSAASPPPPAVPLESVGVSLYTSAGTLAARAVTDAFGQYSATVPAGSYRALTDPLSGFVQMLYDGKSCPQGACDVTVGTPIAVSSTAVTGIDFALSACSAMTVSPIALAQGAVGTSYRQVLSASGGTAPIRFTVTSGVLPPGLTLDASTGVLSGTPTAAGRYAFTVSAEDNTGCAGSRSYVLDIPACPFVLSGTSASLRARGEPWLISVTNACGAWLATSNASWITVSSTTATSVLIVAAPNTDSGSRTGTVTIGPRVFTVHQSGVAAAPAFGFVDTPVDGVTVSGSVAVSGWALDDLAVTRVLIYRDPIASEPQTSQIFLGTATFVPGARPDVQAAFPTWPRSDRAGWGYLLLTNMLPTQGNGTFRVYAYAEDSDLNITQLGSRTINAANSSATVPFGAIDTPAQGATVNGSRYINWGWALTPQPKLIATDGSTISVVLDGVPVGTLTEYNLFRSDVSTLFPGVKNSGGPVGYRAIDTTALSEGLHTIGWVVTDDAGKATGIGSRYFTVQNSAWLPSLRSAFQQAAVAPAISSQELATADATTAVPPRIPGADIDRRAASLATLPVGEGGVRALTMGPLQRLELELLRDGTSRGCPASYEGYEIVQGALRDLPIGASLDRAGTFYWQPGPGFLGTYHLLFVKTTCDGTRERVPVAVTIR